VYNSAKKHFKKSDPILFGIAKKAGKIEEMKQKEPEEYFFYLCRSIVTQQLSVKAARKIFERFLTLFPEDKITTKHLLTLPDQNIRNIGTSWSKVSYIKDLASKVENKEVSLEKLPTLEDKKVIEELVKVKGIGAWTAEMFLIFSLGRKDVFSTGDLGLKRAIEKHYNIKDPSKERLEKISAKWSPYRSYACKILWNSLDNE